MGACPSPVPAEMRGPAFAQGGHNPMEGMGVGLLLCLACCLCIFVTIVIAYFIWAVVTIFDTADAYAVPCAEDSNIWVFSMAFVIVAPVLGCCVSIIQAILRSVDNNAMFFMQFIPGCITLVLSVWGVLLWANMTEQCHHFYEAEYPNLLLLFKISVILGVISFVGVLCMLCVLGSVLVMGLSQMNSGTGAGYH